jgi:hypothetical protein
MIVDTPDLDFSAQFDRDIAWWRGGSCRYLVTEITARNVKAGSKRPNHALAVAIDASTSMEGFAFRSVQALAKGLAARLGPSDSIAIVSFADEARIELASTSADDIGRASACAAIDGIELRSGTDFIEGWLAAAEQIASIKEEHPDDFAIVVIASDGRANRGLLHPEEVARHAAELRARGVPTTAVAAGEECDLSLLVAVDDPGSLQEQSSVAVGETAVDALVANSLELLPEVAEDVEICVIGPPRTTITVLGTYSSERDGERLVCSLGNMRAASRRLVVLKAILPEGEEGATVNFAVELSWTDRSGRRHRTRPRNLTQTFARGAENTPQKRDPRATLTVLAQWRLKLLRDLIGLNRQGRLREAEAYLAREMKFFERYAYGVPEVAPLLTELRLALPAVHRPWRERILTPTTHRIPTDQGE